MFKITLRNNTLFILVTLLTVSSCKSENEQLKERIKPVLTKFILQDSILVKIDSLLIDSIQTFSETEWSKEKIIRYQNLIIFNNKMAEFSEERLKLLNETAKIETKGDEIDNETMAILLNDNSYQKRKPKPRVTTEFDINNEKEKLLKYKKNIANYNALIEELKKNINLNKYNSDKKFGYKPYFRVIGADENNVEIKDTLAISLSENLNILQIK